MKFTFRAAERRAREREDSEKRFSWKKTRQALLSFWRWLADGLVYIWNWICHFAHAVTELQPTRGVLVAAVALILVLCAVCTMPSAFALMEKKQVTLKMEGQQIDLTTKAVTVAELLSNMGLSLSEGDVISPALSHVLQDGDVVALRAAKKVRVWADGRAVEVHMIAGSVRQALYLAGIELGEHDRVTPDLDEQVEAGQEIQVYRIQVRLETEEQGIPYQEVYVEESSLYEGETELSRQGSEGIRQLQIRVVLQDGVEVERSVVGESILEPAVDRIIYKGTKKKPTPTPKPTKKPSSTKKPSTSGGSSSGGSSSGGSRPSVTQGPKGNYSESEVRMAAQLAYLEGNGAGSDGYKAILNVLVNRCNSSKFGGSIEDEIFRSGQFTVARDRDSFLATEPDSKAKAAAEAVLNDGERLLPSSVLYFRSARLGKDWGSRTYYGTIGANSFFK